jgi:hypothetical protein
VTQNPDAPPADAHSLWTIARIHNTLTSPTMTRRFLDDLVHAPEHEVMNVFAAWRRVAATADAGVFQVPKSLGAPGCRPSGLLAE